MVIWVLDLLAIRDLDVCLLGRSQLLVLGGGVARRERGGGRPAQQQRARAPVQPAGPGAHHPAAEGGDGDRCRRAR